MDKKELKNQPRISMEKFLRQYLIANSHDFSYVSI